MMGWLAKIAGPRVLLGVTLAGAAGMGMLFWLYSDAVSKAASQGQRAAELRQAVADERDAVEQLKAERARLEAALSAARQARQVARDRADQTRQDLSRLEETDESVQDWANQRVPRAVADRLRQYAGQARDQDEDGQDQATE